MLDLAVNIVSFKHLLARIDFCCTVNHLALVHIMKSKSDSPTIRVKRLLQILSAYTFNLFYIKCKNLTSSGFFSRIDVDNEDPGQIIPISFNIQEVLNEKYHIETRAKTTVSGVKAPNGP